MPMKKYTAQELRELTGVSNGRLSQYRSGREVVRNGKTEWNEPPFLDETDFERVIENGRAKIYYYETALQKIREKRSVK